MKNLTYRLSAYEGPIDLLYQLIKAQEIDILDIPIAQITEQYLSFLENAEDRDMESMSEFALMAATLLEIKSKMLLPVSPDSDEEDPRKELVDILLEYKKVKMAADLFMNLDQGYGEIFFKAPETELLEQLKPKPSIDEIMGGVTLSDLFDIFTDVMSKKELKVDKIRSSFKSIQRDMFTVEEKMEHLRGVFSEKTKVFFRQILTECRSRSEMIVTFLALLEMIKTKEIKVKQKDQNGDIEIRRTELLAGGLKGV